MAIVITKNVRHIAGSFVLLSLMNFARKIPPKKVVNVATIAQISVQIRIRMNTYPNESETLEVKRVWKFFKPTQVNRYVGG